MMIVAVILVLVLGVLVVAWIDGGREDLRQITQPVAFPDLGPDLGPEPVPETVL